MKSLSEQPDTQFMNSLLIFLLQFIFHIKNLDKLQFVLKICGSSSSLSGLYFIKINFINKVLTSCRLILRQGGASCRSYLGRCVACVISSELITLRICECHLRSYINQLLRFVNIYSTYNEIPIVPNGLFMCEMIPVIGSYETTCKYEDLSQNVIFVKHFLDLKLNTSRNVI